MIVQPKICNLESWGPDGGKTIIKTPGFLVSKKSMDRTQVKVRWATQNDVSLIFAFIQKKADFDRAIDAFSGELRTSEEKIQKTLFGPHPFAYVLLAEVSGHEVGFALFGFRYSSFVGQPSIWLDDLYVDAEMRSQGAGTALMRHLAQVAKQTECTHLAWTADARNTDGLRFYHHLGAKITEQKGNRCFLAWTL